MLEAPSGTNEQIAALSALGAFLGLAELDAELAACVARGQPDEAGDLLARHDQLTAVLGQARKRWRGLRHARDLAAGAGAGGGTPGGL